MNKVLRVLEGELELVDELCSQQLLVLLYLLNLDS